jgi:hypothetical protein
VLPFEPGHPDDLGGFLGVLSLLIVTTTDLAKIRRDACP